ncbi:hypothetical protein [Rhodococcus sp. 14-2470-1a]|uniref:hypothetical protein n=1 Tax=Rhodococcus sp. 14-2470-1a TaxID=2023150 RepID=UPI0015C5ED79|nr:hypothetical protein [Rhodococcus sp. 14-2470-1a]
MDAAVRAAQEWFLAQPPERQVGIYRYLAGKEAATHTEVEGQLEMPLTHRRVRTGKG